MLHMFTTLRIGDINRSSGQSRRLTRFTTREILVTSYRRSGVLRRYASLTLSYTGVLYERLTRGSSRNKVPREVSEVNLHLSEVFYVVSFRTTTRQVLKCR